MSILNNKKKRSKPRFKKLLLARENILNKKKILELKKPKWKTFQFFYNKKLKFFTRYKAFDQKRYIVTKNAKKGVAYDKRYRETVNAIRNFKLFYGNLKQKHFKTILKKTLKEHNRKKFKLQSLNSVFLNKIENRLDVILFRSKFCLSIYLSRQIIKHGKVKINKQIVKNKFYKVNPGDFIEIDKSIFYVLKKINKELGWKKTTWPHSPPHLYLNYKTLHIVVGDSFCNNFENSFTFNLKLEKTLLNYLKKH